MLYRWSSSHLRLKCRTLPQHRHDLGGEGPRVLHRRVEIADLTAIQAFDRAAEAEDRSERLALVHLRLEHRHAMLFEFGSDVLQRPRPDRGAGASEQHGIRDFAHKRLFLLPDQLDRLRSLAGVELAALARDDDQIGAADRVGHRNADRAFQGDNYERRAGGGRLDIVYDSLFGDVSQDLEAFRLAGSFRPGGDGSVGVSI